MDEIVLPATALKPDHLMEIAKLAQIVLADTSFEDVMQQVVDLTKEIVPGAEAVSVTLVTGDHANSAAWTSDVALQLDERQYSVGYGPCLDAAVSGITVRIANMITDERWPEFSALAVQAGARSSLSVALPVQQQSIGALNIYAFETDAFGEDSAELAQVIASYAAVALANASHVTSTASLAQQMQHAMKTRAIIEQAKGIIMRDQQCSADVAFTVLTKASQNANKKLRDVAALVVESAENP